MNIEIANRLINLRKKNGLSQEELANKLGLSRQAVSKWERAEASPDTDNLICLAKLYGVSLDELLKTDDGVETIVDEQIKGANSSSQEKGPSGDNAEIHINSADGDKIHITKDGLYVLDGDGSEISIKGGNVHIKDGEGDAEVNFSTLNIVEGCLTGFLLLSITAVYVTLGCLYEGVWPYPLVWPIGWIAYLSIPLLACVFETIKKKTFSSFCGVVVFLAVIAYLILGLCFNLWHPGWVVFLAIPLYGVLAGSLDKILKNKNSVQRKKGEE